ncbi:MAG: HTH domain-containing protein, partial [Syntrophales bacterium]|nr:HTH domain-containing protein [Syntrophales bacterium]
MKTTSREMLLKELKREPGQWVSGRYLSERLAVSRCAVWKQAAALKEGGYIIEASPRKGYRLQGVPDLLTPEEIRDGLGTELFGQLQIHHRTDVASTNLLAKELALRGAPEGTLVVAEGQTAGRGRRGRGWYSP